MLFWYVFGVTLTTIFGVQDVQAWGTNEAPATEPPVQRGEAEDESLQTVVESLRSIGIQTFPQTIPSVDFALRDLTGKTVSLSDYEGEFVFLNFWATWCPPCREEMPSMEVLHERTKGMPFRIVAVNVGEDQQTVASFIEREGYTFPVLLDESSGVSQNYSVRGIPTSYFITPDGLIVGMLVGTRYWDEPDVLQAIDTIAETVAKLQ